ncbi:sulfite exporter TauE/SafE family protein [Ramlibacter sp. PS4R-6]|uniref:sulfite exporter TauE/SafE family protein n=1 Tax=Ramlibacter sp. PS4R-6 TaxID=3133438 RepID=UPI003097657F
MDATVLIVVVGAALAGFVQGLSGFGFGLTAMSVWAWALEPRLAAALAVFGGMCGQLIAVFSVRRGFDLKRLAPFVLGGLAGLPIGLWLLPRLDVPLFKTVLGAFLLVVCPLMLVAERLPKVTHGGRIADAAAGAAGGVMGGLGGFTGVVPTLWCTLRGYEKDAQRSIIQNFNLSMLCVTFASYLATGILHASQLPLLAVVLPAMVVPSLLGARLYARISQEAFRRVVLGLLAASGAALLVSGAPAVLAGGP